MLYVLLMIPSFFGNFSNNALIFKTIKRFEFNIKLSLEWRQIYETWNWSWLIGLASIYKIKDLLNNVQGKVTENNNYNII